MINEYRHSGWFSDSVHYIEGKATKEALDKATAETGITVYGSWNLVVLLAGCFGWELVKLKLTDNTEVYVDKKSLIDYAARFTHGETTLDTVAKIKKVFSD